MYSYNPDLDFMLIPDRSLFILQKFGISMSKKEFLAIRRHDGVFDKANEAYFFSNIEFSVTDDVDQKINNSDLLLVLQNRRLLSSCTHLFAFKTIRLAK